MTKKRGMVEVIQLEMPCNDPPNNVLNGEVTQQLVCGAIQYMEGCGWGLGVWMGCGCVGCGVCGCVGVWGCVCVFL